jgi:endo-1,4-beta-xylanase
MKATCGSLTRRQLITGTVATVAGAWSNGVSRADPIEEPLHERAARRGLLFGVMVTRHTLERDPACQQAAIRDAAILVPGDEMKWGYVEAKPGVPNFTDADWVANFARQNRRMLRAQPAIWAQNVPQWLPAALASNGNTVLFKDHIANLVTRYSGRAQQWDVVNEALEPLDRQSGGFRNSIFYKAFGHDYIATAFRAAKSSDPHAKLYYNDYGVEYFSPDEEARRRALLALLTVLKRDNVPIDGLGIQSHLKVGNRFNPKVFRAFLAQVSALGLQIMLTEFDVDDVRLPVDIDTRDRAVADHAKQFLDIALDEKAVAGLIAWGISDRYTWLNVGTRARADHVKHRALPLDEQMRRKPLWYAIANSLDHAPRR